METTDWSHWNTYNTMSLVSCPSEEGIAPLSELLEISLWMPTKTKPLNNSSIRCIIHRLSQKVITAQKKINIINYTKIKLQQAL